MSIVGILADDADPMVSVMKVEKAPLESYADIGGLQDQVRHPICRDIRQDVSMLKRLYAFTTCSLLQC